MQDSSNGRRAVIKVLAIVGFLATITVGVWFMVQVVGALPGAFSSLASIANSLNTNRGEEELTVATGRSIVNSDELFTISWTTLDREGTYQFSYACTEGISLDVETENGTLVPVPCGEVRSLPEGENTLDVRIASERRRFSDVPFTIAFVESDEVVTERTNKVTVVNATIPLSAELAENGESTSTDETSEGTEEEDTVTEQPTTPSPTSAPRPTPQTTPQVITVMPQSDENGFTDLAIRYLGIGELDDDTFVPRATLDNDTRGALKFEVKNIGTKTSEEWAFTVNLPSGFEYESDEQAALKPNERVEFTLGFSPSESEDDADISAEIFADEDTNSRNDRFTWSVEVTD